MSKRVAEDADASNGKRRQVDASNGAAAGAGGAAAPGSREAFLEEFRVLTNEFCDEIMPSYEMPPEARSRIRSMMEYTCPTGKLNRGLTVVHATQTIRGDAITPLELKQARVLGWCVEYLQACFLLADDVMDHSITRRGQPCWYQVKDVGLIAINDAFLLRSALFMLAKRHFSKLPFYGRLLELFNETTFQTELGQDQDLTSAPIDGPVDFTYFTKERYHRIVKYKTSFYSFYLPVALAMLLCGETSEDEFEIAKGILTDMGVYFQVQDDYLDCYGTPEVIGKIGTDIQDNKCGWLIVQALDRVNEEQRKMLQENYGKNSDESVERVKALYRELDLEKLYKEYEERTYKSLCERIDALKGKTPGKVFHDLLAKVYKRGK